MADLIETFRHTYTAKRYATPKGAFGRCDDACRRFRHFLSLHGVSSRVVQVCGALFPTPEAHRPWRDIPPEKVIHYVVAVDGGPVIDWTSRQFLPESPCPMVLRDEDVRAMWQMQHPVPEAHAEGEQAE